MCWVREGERRRTEENKLVYGSGEKRSSHCPALLRGSFIVTLALSSHCCFEVSVAVCSRRLLWCGAWIIGRRDPFAVLCVGAFGWRRGTKVLVM